jgi:hypothetical protein
MFCKYSAIFQCTDHDPVRNVVVFLNIYTWYYYLYDIEQWSFDYFKIKIRK